MSKTSEGLLQEARNLAKQIDTQFTAPAQQVAAITFVGALLGAGLFAIAEAVQALAEKGGGK